MSIKYYANRVQESTISVGAGNLVLTSVSGYRTFVAAIGANNRLTYYIYRSDTNFEWEIGVGYILSTGGINQLVRERIIASSNGGSLVGFTSGTKYVESIIGEDRVNTSLLNVETKSNNFVAQYIPATYVIDASTNTNISVSLPQVATQNDPISIGFVLNRTSGNVYEQLNAIQLIPSGLETIAGTTGVDISILNDYLQIMSVPSQSGWILLDPIQDATNPYGYDGTVQLKQGNAFSGVSSFTWDSSNKLLIGSSGVGTADVVIPASSGQTIIFNQNLVDNDLRIAGSGNSHLLFVDGGLNRVGVNTSIVPDTLSVGGGITVSKSGTGPAITLYNSSASGITTNDTVGAIAFSGLNNSGTIVQYGKISSIIESTSDSSEYSSLMVETLNNGAIEPIAIFSPSGVTLGSNSQNLDGVVLGAGSNNEGNNIVAGYFNNVCGDNCIILGDNIVVSSGTFGGAIGSDHAVSGTNIWVIGGSGVSVTGSNKTILGLDDNNYVQIVESGYKYTTLTDSDMSFVLENISILTSGIDQNITFTFLNSSGVTKTGLLITSSLKDVTNLTEDSAFVAKILSSGNQIKVLDLQARTIILGENNVSGNNIVFGINNNITSNSSNIIYGSGITATGANNVLIGRNINLVASGTGITVIGSNNECLTNSNLGTVLIGNGNQADEDYGIAIGTDNATSGLYTVACGYLNGIHGDYSVGVGETNFVTSNYSVAVGRNNYLGSTDLAASLFALGVGNSGSISNTGIIIGYLNELYGSGSIIIGNDCWISGSNNLAIGYGITYSGNNTVLISGATTNINGNNISLSGANIDVIGTSNLVLKSNDNHKFTTTPTLTSIYGSSGIYASGSVLDFYGTTDIDIVTNSNNNIRIATTGLDITGTKVLTRANSSNYDLVSSTGIDMVASRIYSFINTNNYTNLTSTGIFIQGSGQINASVNNSNYQKISTTGLDMYGSGVSAYVDGSNYFTIRSTGVSLLGSGVLIKSDNNNYQTITTSGIDIIGTGILARVDTDNYITIENSGVDVYGNEIQFFNTTNTNNYARVLSTGIYLNSLSGVIDSYVDTNNNINISISGVLIKGNPVVISGINASNKIIVDSSGTSLFSDTIITQYINSKSKTELSPSGYDITAFSGTRINVSSDDIFSYTIANFSGSGLTINNWDDSNFDEYTNTIINQTGIFIYNASGSNSTSNPLTTVFASGLAGFGQSNPEYTVDISGTFRVANTGSGIIYTNIPTSTGAGSNLVVENDIIKIGYGGVNVSSLSPATSGNLLSSSKDTQLLDPAAVGTYTLLLTTGNMIEGRKFYIRNTTDNPGNELIALKDQYSNSTIYTLGDSGHGNYGCMIVFDGTQWRLLMAGK